MAQCLREYADGICVLSLVVADDRRRGGQTLFLLYGAVYRGGESRNQLAGEYHALETHDGWA